MKLTTDSEKRALDRVKALIFLRLIAVLVSLAVILVSQAGRDLVRAELYPTYLLLVLVCLANLVYLFMVKRVRDARRFAVVQITLDVLFASALVYLNGAGASNITFLYFACILAASTILGLRPGVLVASLATVALAAMRTMTSLAGHYGWTLPLVHSPGPEGPLVGFYDGVAYLMAQAIAYHLVAVLAGRLAHGLSGVRMLNEKILESISDGILAIDGGRRVRAVNREAARLLGLPSVLQSVGKTLDEVLSASPNAQALKELFKGEQPGISQIPLTSTDGRVAPVALTSSALRDESGRKVGLVVMLIDLTERKRLEEALARAETMEMMGQLAASIAHEIRNPLACIRGSAQEIRSELAGNGGRFPHSQTQDHHGGPSSEGSVPDLCKLLDLVVRESDRINAIVTDFLHFSRLRRTALTRTNLTRVIADVVTMLENRRSAGRITVDFDGSTDVFCLGDVEQLRQVFLNLGLNAIDAMPRGGTLRVLVRHEEPARSVEDVSRYGSRVVVEFTDEGVGMTEEVRQQLFSPFFSTKPRGTGLGLCIVRKIIEAHKGTIDVESAPGAGSTFRVTLEGYQSSELAVSHV